MNGNLLFDPPVTACFTGHRIIPQPDMPIVREKVRNAVCQAYADGYRTFLCGGARGFDTAAAQEIIRLRDEYPDIRLIIVIPCATQAEKWNEEDRRIYQAVLEQADGKVVLSETYYTGCMQVRNRYMVDASSLCLCWMTGFTGGTWSTVRYALRCGILLKNLAMPGNDPLTMREKPWNSIFIFPSAQKNAPTVPLYPFRQQRFRRKNISTPFCGRRK